MIDGADSKRIGGAPSSVPGRDASDAAQFKLPAKASVAGPAAPAPQGVGSALESLGTRLGELRRKSGLTQIVVSSRMGSTQPALARLEKGEMKPNLRTLARYAQAIDQEMEITFSGSPVGDKSVQSITRDLEAVPTTLAGLRRELGVTQSQVASRMETTQPVIARLESGDMVPNLRTLERYAEAIDIRIDINFRPSSRRA